MVHKRQGNAKTIYNRLIGQGKLLYARMYERILNYTSLNAALHGCTLMVHKRQGNAQQIQNFAHKKKRNSKIILFAKLCRAACNMSSSWWIMSGDKTSLERWSQLCGLFAPQYHWGRAWSFFSNEQHMTLQKSRDFCCRPYTFLYLIARHRTTNQYFWYF
jgi:hypothetical protein